MQQYNITKGIWGIVGVYNDALRFRDMITQKRKNASASLYSGINMEMRRLKRRSKYPGLSLPVAERAQKGRGKIEALNPQSTAPKTRRVRLIPDAVGNLIIKERSYEKIGKEKLAVLLQEDGIGIYSPSTVGRMLADLKKQGKLPHPVRYSLSGKTGNLIERKPRQYKKKLRSAGHLGQLAKADTIIRFTNGIKRYIFTGIDCESEFAFAYAYASHSSKQPLILWTRSRGVAPLSLAYVQTDNGRNSPIILKYTATKKILFIFMPIPERQRCKVELSVSIALFQKRLFQETGIYSLMILRHSTRNL